MASWTFDLTNGTFGGTNGFGSPDDEVWRFQTFTAGGTSLTRTDVNLNDTGVLSPAMVTACIYTTAFGLPEFDAALDCQTFDASGGGVFSLSWSLSLTLGQTYALLLTIDPANNPDAFYDPVEWVDHGTDADKTGQNFGKVIEDGTAVEENFLGCGYLYVAGTGAPEPTKHTNFFMFF
jgi:hypothetical protein